MDDKTYIIDDRNLEDDYNIPKIMERLKALGLIGADGRIDQVKFDEFLRKNALQSESTERA